MTNQNPPSRDEFPGEFGPPAEPVRGYRPSGSQWAVAGLVLAFGCGALAYRLVKHEGQYQSAALYVGIPIVLALVLVLTAPAGRAAGMAMKVTTILLLLSVPVLGEGACCVLMAAPIFYLFVYLATASLDRYRTAGPDDRGPFLLIAPVMLVAMALEGTTPALTFPGAATTTATRTIDVPEDRVADALALPMRFDATPRTGILAIGFPVPRHDSGGLAVGDLRTIEFDGAHHRHGPIAQHHWGTHPSALVLRVAARTDRSVVFVPVSDTTPVATWLRWDRIEVSWRDAGAGRSEVRWQQHYTRLLSPSWYFGPIERFVTQRAGDYLIRAVDTRAPDPMQHAHHT
ncbi:hypothetical protein HUN08_07990 [Gordonia sp. X0973]|uniref:hypothetical protein n=1 Tax=Gordonia sp. X0973 TaxID=2742602 RepID=UPI000F544781|nr:hypothetical protein [Gordonia sp. X0973]QKT07146.1 hypothetical protein HUN08_07990 [Gordonia sp. X0973]